MVGKVLAAHVRDLISDAQEAASQCMKTTDDPLGRGGVPIGCELVGVHRVSILR